MRRFYLHVRKGVYYAELIDPATGQKLTARSTGRTSRDEALIIVADWLNNGIPKKGKTQTLEAAAEVELMLRQIKHINLNSDDALRIVKLLRDRQLIDVSAVKHGKGSISFNRFLKSFWNYETSEYIKEKHAHGQSIGKMHAKDSIGKVKYYWLPYFEGRQLNTITRDDLKAFSLSLSMPKEKPERKGLIVDKLSPNSINRVMTAGLTALKWAYREGLIPDDPTNGLIHFSGKTKKRGVLTEKEAETLFNSEWKDKRAYTASLACTTGMRSGEVLAVKKDDIEEFTLNVRHSWNDYDGLKSPKNGESRKVPLYPEVKIKLLELLKENPHGENGFIFYGAMEDKPIDKNVLLKGLHEALKEIGIDHKERGIVFHSWRHYYAARMADKMTAEQISRVTGHKSKAVFEEYADHITEKNLKEVGKVGAEVFGNILQFRKDA